MLFLIGSEKTSAQSNFWGCFLHSGKNEMHTGKTHLKQIVSDAFLDTILGGGVRKRTGGG
jgi:hypothetical protein